MRSKLMTKRLWTAGALALLMTGASLAIGTGNRVDGEVIQPRVHGGESFTFSVKGSVEGEVIDIRTVDGEVITSAKSDRHGRVFLPAGLAAGSYLVSAAANHGRPGKLDVHAAAPNPVPVELVSMSLTSVPPAIDLAEPFRINGTGFDANAAGMIVANSVVQAATQNELVVAPLAQPPGITEILVTKTATGESVASQPVLAYSLEGTIHRNKLMTGEQTYLEFNFEPKEQPIQVEASIVNGPVSFGDGRQSASRYVTNGNAILPIVADGGAGPFTITWMLRDDAGPQTPQEWVQKKAEDCAAASQLTENSLNEKELGNEAELDEKLTGSKDFWDKDGKPKDAKKLMTFLNAEIARLKKIARREGSGNAKDKIADAIESAYKAGKAAGLKLDAK